MLVSESPINADNEPLTTILNSKRGLLITKKNIARTPKPKNAPPSDTESLLKFMMASTDFLIENGFANLDLKPQNIGILESGNELRINDNGANMFYPIPSKYKEHYRDAIKLVALFSLSRFGFGLDKTMFDANKELYPNINYQRAMDLCIEFNQEEEKEIRDYAKEKMSTVHVDGKDEDLSSLFDDILFPDQLVTWYGGQYDPDNFIENLRMMGIISDEEREQNEAEKRRQDEAERQERERQEAERQEAERRERFQRIEREGNLELKKKRNNKNKNKNNTVRKERKLYNNTKGRARSKSSRSSGSRSRGSRSSGSRSRRSRLT